MLGDSVEELTEKLEILRYINDEFRKLSDAKKELLQEINYLTTHLDLMQLKVRGDAMEGDDAKRFLDCSEYHISRTTKEMLDLDRQAYELERIVERI